MKKRSVTTTRKEHIATLTFHGRGDLNILHGNVVAQLGLAIERLESDPATRVVVLRGSGRAFSAGVDVQMMKEFTPVEMEEFIRSLHSVMTKVMSTPCPVIASIHGPCLGGAFELVMACDLRIAADDAIFGLPEIRVGIPSVIEASLLARLIGWGRATELVLTGETIDAREALRIGLVNRVVPKRDLTRETMKVARALTMLSPISSECRRIS